jgi:arylesterase/paraoxonase
LEFLRHSLDADYVSPSEVIAINVDTRPMTTETLFLDDGNLVSGSSVAARRGEHLLIGVVLEEQLTHCRDSAPASP